MFALVLRGVVEPDELGWSGLGSSSTRWTLRRASLSSESERSSKGSRLERIVPENKTGSCGIIARRDRRSYSLILEMSIPSTNMDPSLASRKRKSASVRLDFPAPVRPTTPTRCLGWTSNVSPLGLVPDPGHMRQPSYRLPNVQWQARKLAHRCHPGLLSPFPHTR